MATRLPTRTFDLPDGSVIVVEDFDPGTVLPTNTVKIRFNQTAVFVSRPARFLAIGPVPTDYANCIEEGIRVLRLALAAVNDQHDDLLEGGFFADLPSSSGHSPENVDG